MRKFDYTARSSSGEALQGVVSAASTAEATRLLRTEGKFVVKLTEISEAVDAAAVQLRFSSRRVRQDDVIFFASQMAVMVDTGVSITDALSGIIEQTASPAFKSVLDKVLADVEGGTPFSLALAKHPQAFRPLFVNLVKASEASGKLGPLLNRCATYMINQRDTRKKVIGAMIYPAFLMFLSVGVVIFLLTYLMPKFTRIYEGREELLPLPTKMLVATSGYLTENWVWWLSGSLVFLVGFMLFFRSERGTRPAHWSALNAPLIGRMMRKAYLVRSLRTLGTLIDSGVAMLDSVSITRAIVGNRYFQDMWDDVDARVQQGEQLSNPLLKTRLMPRAVTQMIRAGERSGQLGTVLDRICDFLERDLEQTIKRVTLMVEPLMIFVMGLIVGGIAIALLLPIFMMSRIMAH